MMGSATTTPGDELQATLHGEEHVPFGRLTGLRFIRAVASFISSEVDWKARGLFGLLIAFLFGMNGVNVEGGTAARPASRTREEEREEREDAMANPLSGKESLGWLRSTSVTAGS
jgi:hypothetical protein